MPHIFIPPEFQNLEKSLSFWISSPDLGFPTQISDFQFRFWISSSDFGKSHRPGPTRTDQKKGNAKPKKGTQQGTHPFFQNGDFARGILHFLKKGTHKGNAKRERKRERTHFWGYEGPGQDFRSLGPNSTRFLKVGAQIWDLTSQFRISVLKLAGCSLAPHTLHAHEPIQLELDPRQAWVQLWQRPDLLLQVLPYRCTSY